MSSSSVYRVRKLGFRQTILSIPDVCDDPGSYCNKVDFPLSMLYLA
ncbi:hypothetical protein WG66_010048 [Moniliophthora roreri]|nr:hypothetical protein WG66_010048 [Moniliophthora roreri]